MKLYLKVLSVIYFFGFLLHLADLLDLRLHFSEMNLTWKTWIIFLISFDFLVAIGLWKTRLWGIAIFFLVARAQILAYSIFKDLFGNQELLICFHLLSIGLLIFICLRGFYFDIRQSGEEDAGRGLRAVGNLYKMVTNYLKHKVSFGEAAATIPVFAALVDVDQRHLNE